MLTTLFTLAGGLVLLVLGGELLVRGSVQVAERLGVSPLLIGLTLVGLGTSMPELVTSVEASLVGAPGIALGNIVGSNIANILLVIGLSAIIFPLRVGASALKRDGSFVIATALLFSLAGYTIGLDRIAGGIFIVLLVTYMVYAYRQESQPLMVEELGHTAAFDKGEAVEQVDKTLHGRTRAGLLGWFLPIGLALAGLAIIIAGGQILVDAAVQLSRALGLSESVIGLTVVAVGTSLPEFVTSVVAAIRRQSDIAVGNVLGSNIYNVLGIGGVTGLIAPAAFPPEMLRVDLFVMIAASVLLFLFSWNGKVSRLEGLVLLVAYTAYTVYLLTR